MRGTLASPVCPHCGCSLARLGMTREAATASTYNGEELLFCCQGCLDGFKADPERFLAEIRDLIVCPTCLGEKPRKSAISIEHEGNDVYFCRCPYCVEHFEKEPEPLLARLTI
jgi:YHS domain-containing protein